MPTNMPNFNFFALLISEIWRGPKIKSGVLISPDALNRYILHGAIVPANAYHCTKFNFLTRLVSEIWGGLKIKN